MQDQKKLRGRGWRMDDELDVTLLDIERGVVVCAIPSEKVPIVANLHAGTGILCPWSNAERLRAYKGICDHAERAIAKLEAADD